mgnify:FL=1
MAEIVGRVLAAEGAAHVFGVVGSGNLRMTNELIRQQVPFTATRHEMGATAMADAYARVSERLTVVTLHQGCGFSNALTAVAEAAKAHTPVLVLTGDTASGDLGSNFYVDQDAAAEAMGAKAFRVYSAKSAARDTARAVAAAVDGRQTVVLSVPVDIQEEKTDFDVENISRGRTVTRVSPDPRALEAVVDVLEHAARPVLVAGRGAKHSRDEILRLGELCGGLLVTSAGARGLFAGEEWALDIMGGFSTPGAADLIASADVIVVFGAALNRWTARDGVLLQDAFVVQIDDRPAAIGLHRDVDLSLIGDTSLAAADLVRILRGRGVRHTGFRTDDVRERVERDRYWKDQPFAERDDAGCIDPRVLTNYLDDLLPLERVVVPDGGNANCYPAANLRVPDERGYCLPFCFQAIGLGLSACIGAALAEPGRLPVVGTGDGSFMMGVSELDTAVRLGLGMMIIVYNDSAYGAEIIHFAADGDDFDLVRFPETDIAAVARGFGCDAITVRRREDLEAATDWLEGPRSRPLVIDAKIATFPSWNMRRMYGDVEVPAPTR